ncbi:hypothetical protein F4779DRAFT_623734 [Xylariaceae sp. FL0662B]|nr:hypothetical protein F4779DRAFT_623734 [Xylariaceae sp. FL0662B]
MSQREANTRRIRLLSGRFRSSRRGQCIQHNRPQGPRIRVVGAWAPERRQETFRAEVDREIEEAQQRLTRARELSRLPRLIKAYLDHGRLFSIYDRVNHEFVYHADRDANKPILMTTIRGRVVLLYDYESRCSLYMYGVTHGDERS